MVSASSSTLGNAMPTEGRAGNTVTDPLSEQALIMALEAMMTELIRKRVFGIFMVRTSLQIELDRHNLGVVTIIINQTYHNTCREYT